jgi:hypothetical protein
MIGAPEQIRELYTRTHGYGGDVKADFVRSKCAKARRCLTLWHVSAEIARF